MIALSSIGLTPSRRVAVDRRADRLVAVASIMIAVAFLCLALLAAVLPSEAQAGVWLPLHLALAGAATTAIAGIMPFFSAAFAAAQPVPAPVRWGSLASVAIGSLGIAYGFTRGTAGLAVAGGLLFIVGIVLVGVATLVPVTRGLGPRGGVVTAGYAGALGFVTIGALLAVLFLAGWMPVVEAWGRLKPAHAWLNLVGFVSLVIATTLLHFFPTVVGARIRRVPSAHLTIAGIGLGAPAVALGYALGAPELARLGAIGTLIGAAALAIYALGTWRTRAGWRTDRDWHRFAMGGLASALVWFVLSVTLSALRLLLDGTAPGVLTGPLLGPYVLGWMGLAVLASATHLVPAIGPGDPQAHLRQRQLLGRGANSRLVAANVGIAALASGRAFELEFLVALGLVSSGGALLVTAALVVSSVLMGLRSRHPSRGA